MPTAIELGRAKYCRFSNDCTSNFVYPIFLWRAPPAKGASINNRCAAGSGPTAVVCLSTPRLPKRYGVPKKGPPFAKAGGCGRRKATACGPSRNFNAYSAYSSSSFFVFFSVRSFSITRMPFSSIDTFASSSST